MGAMNSMTKFIDVGVNDLERTEQDCKDPAKFDSKPVELWKTRSDVIGG